MGESVLQHSLPVCQETPLISEAAFRFPWFQDFLRLTATRLWIGCAGAIGFIATLWALERMRRGRWMPTVLVLLCAGIPWYMSAINIEAWVALAQYASKNATLANYPHLLLEDTVVHCSQSALGAGLSCVLYLFCAVEFTRNAGTEAFPFSRQLILYAVASLLAFYLVHINHLHAADFADRPTHWIYTLYSIKAFGNLPGSALRALTAYILPIALYLGIRFYALKRSKPRARSNHLPPAAIILATTMAVAAAGYCVLMVQQVRTIVSFSRALFQPWPPIESYILMDLWKAGPLVELFRTAYHQRLITLLIIGFALLFGFAALSIVLVKEQNKSPRGFDRLKRPLSLLFVVSISTAIYAIPLRPRPCMQQRLARTQKWEKGRDFKPLVIAPKERRNEDYTFTGGNDIRVAKGRIFWGADQECTTNETVEKCGQRMTSTLFGKRMGQIVIDTRATVEDLRYMFRLSSIVGTYSDWAIHGPMPDSISRAQYRTVVRLFPLLAGIGIRRGTSPDLDGLIGYQDTLDSNFKPPDEYLHIDVRSDRTIVRPYIDYSIPAFEFNGEKLFEVFRLRLSRLDAFVTARPEVPAAVLIDKLIKLHYAHYRPTLLPGDKLPFDQQEPKDNLDNRTTWQGDKLVFE